MIDQQMVELMTRLDRLDERSRDRLLSQVDEQRNDLLTTLVRHLNTSKSPNVQAAAIYLIGRHRLDLGTAELTRRIDFEVVEKRLPGTEPLWERYPAMEALINVGQPSIAPALELLATDPDNLRRDLAVKVIRYVEDAEIARFILQRAQAAETDTNRKVNFKDALVRLDKLPK